MKKQAFLRALLGFPLGMAVGQVVVILISLGWGNGHYAVAHPALVEQMGSEIGAAIFQTVLTGLLGSAFAASSIIWELDHWSLAKQSGVYFAITAVVMLPIAYFANWMEHSLLGFLSYFGIFCVIFLITWVSQYLVWKGKVKQLNNRRG